MRISTHVLDIARGRPAANVPVRLEKQDPSGNWRWLASAQTDPNGRCSQLLPKDPTLTPGAYRLAFDVASYFAAQDVVPLYPVVEITFQVQHAEEDFHIPLLVSGNGFTTYRGS